MFKILETTEPQVLEADQFPVEAKNALDLAILPQERGQELLSATDDYLAHVEGKWENVSEENFPQRVDCLVLVKVLSSQERVVYQIQIQPAFRGIISSTELGQGFPPTDYAVADLHTLETSSIKIANFSHPQPSVVIPEPVVR